MKYLDFKENRQQGTPEFPVAFYNLNPGSPRYEMPYHWHPQQELIRVTQGSFPLTLDGKVYVLEAGDIVYIQDGISHGGTPVDCAYQCLVFDLKPCVIAEEQGQDFMKKIMLHQYSIAPLALNDSAKIRTLTEILFSSMEAGSTGASLKTIGALMLIYGTIQEQGLYYESPVKKTSAKSPSARFKKALNYIESHYAENITLEDMASAVGMNAKYFCRFFKDMSNHTPLGYLNYYRIERACEQLAEKQISVTDAALGNGFNDLSYFIKTFRLQKGVTPGHYLKNEKRTSPKSGS